MSKMGDGTRTKRDRATLGSKERDTQRPAAPKYWGVVEGFYGRPWTKTQRLELFRWLGHAGLNTYFYAPKDDPKHRSFWFERYTPRELRGLAELIAGCRAAKVRFVYGLAPGYRAEFSPRTMQQLLQRKLEQLSAVGCRDFALLFDDIPADGSTEHIRHYGSWSGAHIAWTHGALESMNSTGTKHRFLFCPTPYAGSFAGDVLSNEYLAEVGARLDRGVEVFWTGRDIVSETITRSEIETLGRVIGRPPVLWDNLLANDYDMRRLYLGPYTDRKPELKEVVGGILINPNCEYRANHVAFRTFASFVAAKGSRWNSEAAYEAALESWIPSFQELNGRIPTLPEMRLLADALHLPYRCGREAQGLLKDIRDLLQQGRRPDPRAARRFERAAAVLFEWQVRITELADRDLAYTLYRHVWELKEEIDLLMRYLKWASSPEASKSSFRSMFHQPGTYRDGFVARLQRELLLNDDGTFKVAAKR